MRFDYGGDCKFDAIYLAPGKWCSTVQSIAADGAVVTYGPFASGDIRTAKYVRQGTYGWVNSDTGIGSPERTSALAVRPGPRADSWIITGINYAPGEQVTFFDGSGSAARETINWGPPRPVQTARSKSRSNWTPKPSRSLAR